MLPLQVAVVILTFIVASMLAVQGSNATIAIYHIIFAIGIVPLILGAMVHFVPVLTRSKKPSRIITVLPMVALIGGVVVTSYFIYPQAVPYGQYIGAVIIITVVASLGYWAYRSGCKAIGSPHPCLNWYLAAIACLFLAISAILITYFIPGQRVALRLLHLHLNTLGFIGITALGTLQVLLPTVAQRGDPESATRMRRHLKWAIAGTIFIACGAAWHASFAWIGVALLAIPLVGICKSWLPLYTREIFTLHGATPSLAAALCGFVIAVIIGTAHAYYYPFLNPIATFIIAFLMPLVTGAISYLLPLWLHPGQQTAWHQAARKLLGTGTGLRAMVLLIAGVSAGLGYRLGWVLAAFAISIFFAQILLMFILIKISDYPLPPTITRRDNTKNL